jgi:plasminogen activator inhibitor 1 RNA-binding protein
MSANFFAALDDSGDEAPTASKTNKKVATKKEPEITKPVVEAPKKDAGRKPATSQGDRNTKHGRGGRAPARDGKRAYDRRSGTGRGREVKKDGGGRGNWGSDKAAAKANEGKVVDEVKPVTPEEVAVASEPTPVVAPAPDEPEPEPTPEDNTMTLAEYKAAQAAKKAAEDAAVKEREVENEFAGKTAAMKVEEDFLVMKGAKQKKMKKKNVEKAGAVELGFRVAKPSAGEDRDGGRGEGRGGRGGRGEGRGGRGEGRGGRGEGRGGRGEGRGGRSDGRGARGGRGGRGRGEGRGRGDAPVDVMDTSAFPSL